jgi:hypothetical protein
VISRRPGSGTTRSPDGARTLRLRMAGRPAAGSTAPTQTIRAESAPAPCLPSCQEIAQQRLRRTSTAEMDELRSSGAFAVSRPWRTRETPPRAAAERREPHPGQGCDAGTGRGDPPSFRRDLVSAEGASLDRSPAGRLDFCAVRRDERGIPVLRLLELWLGCRTSIAFEIVVSSGLV